MALIDGDAAEDEGEDDGGRDCQRSVKWPSRTAPMRLTA